MTIRRIYLAARYSRRLELCGYREDLAYHGIRVTSHWLDGNHQLSDTGVPIGDTGEALVESGNDVEAANLRVRFAREDIIDVLAADVLIAFTEPPRSSASRGGRHVEFGIALGARMPVIVVGPRENIFCWLPDVLWYPDWSAALDDIAEMRL